MCKLFCMPGINDDNRETAQGLIFEMAEQMSSESDKDGLGYVSLDKKGDLSGERWLINKEAFIHRIPSGGIDLEVSEDFKGMLKPTIDKKYNTFGENPGIEDSVAILMHTRLATTPKGLINCHPFVSEDGKTALIHNGSINNHEKLTKINSTCDSEVILHEYVKNNVMNEIDNFQIVAEKLVGYYACGVFSETDDGTKILDIWKDDRANLKAAYILELGTYCFTTKIEFLEKACEAMNLTITQVYEVKDDFFARIDPVTGKVLTVKTFKHSDKWETSWGNNYKNRDYNHYTDWRKEDEKKAEEDAKKFFPKNEPEVITGPTEESESRKATDESHAEAVKSFDPSQMANATSKFLERELKKDPSVSVIDVSKLRERLAKIGKDKMTLDIISNLEKNHNWETYYDEALKCQCFRRKTQTA